MTTVPLTAPAGRSWRLSDAWVPWLLFAAAGLALAFFITMSWSTGYIGFPLDDGWIHQTYARNIAQRGEFSFVPGVPSAGSTAPLWSLALALGQAVRAEPRFWSYALGLGSLIACASLVFVQARRWRNSASSDQAGQVEGKRPAIPS